MGVLASQEEYDADMQAAYVEGRKDEAEENGAASQLIAAWAAAHGKPVPSAKAVEIVAIVNKLPEAERIRLLALAEEPKPQPGDGERIDGELRKLWAAFDDWTEQEQGLARTVWLHAEHAASAPSTPPLLTDAEVQDLATDWFDDGGSETRRGKELVRDVERTVRAAFGLKANP